jgi:hypothetical protein
MHFLTAKPSSEACAYNAKAEESIHASSANGAFIIAEQAAAEEPD